MHRQRLRNAVNGTSLLRKFFYLTRANCFKVNVCRTKSNAMTRNVLLTGSKVCNCFYLTSNYVHRRKVSHRITTDVCSKG